MSATSAATPQPTLARWNATSGRVFPADTAKARPEVALHLVLTVRLRLGRDMGTWIQPIIHKICAGSSHRLAKRKHILAEGLQLVAARNAALSAIRREPA